VTRRAPAEANQSVLVPQCLDATFSSSSPSGATLQVSVLSRLGAGSFPAWGAAEDVLCIPTLRDDGSPSSCEVKLRVRRSAPPSAPCFKDDDSIPSRLPTQASAREYLERHDLQQDMQFLIGEVLRREPEDPYAHMANLLRERKAQLSQLQAQSSSSSRPPGGGQGQSEGVCDNDAGFPSSSSLTGLASSQLPSAETLGGAGSASALAQAQAAMLIEQVTRQLAPGIGAPIGTRIPSKNNASGSLVRGII